MAKMKLAQARFLQTAPDEFERLLKCLVDARDNEDPYAIRRVRFDNDAGAKTGTSTTKYLHELLPVEQQAALNGAVVEYYRKMIVQLLDKIDDLDISTTDERERLGEALTGNDDNGTDDEE